MGMGTGPGRGRSKAGWVRAGRYEVNSVKLERKCDPFLLLFSCKMLFPFCFFFPVLERKVRDDHFPPPPPKTIHLQYAT